MPLLAACDSFLVFLCPKSGGEGLKTAPALDRFADSFDNIQEAVRFRYYSRQGRTNCQTHREKEGAGAFILISGL